MYILRSVEEAAQVHRVGARTPNALLRRKRFCEYVICCEDQQADDVVRSTGENLERKKKKKNVRHDHAVSARRHFDLRSRNAFGKPRIASTVMHGFSQRGTHSAAGDHFESESAFRMGLYDERRLKRLGKFLERREPHTAAAWMQRLRKST